MSPDWTRIAGGDPFLASELAEAEWVDRGERAPWYLGRARVEARLELAEDWPALVHGLPPGRAPVVGGAVFRWRSSTGLVTNRRAVVGVGVGRWRGWFEAELAADPP